MRAPLEAGTNFEVQVIIKNGSQTPPPVTLDYYENHSNSFSWCTGYGPLVTPTLLNLEFFAVSVDCPSEA